MAWTDIWRDVRDCVVPPKTVPAREAIQRLRDSSGPFPVLPPAPPAQASLPVEREITPFADEAPGIPPPAWDQVFPGHYRALVADLAKRGEHIGNWEIQDGRDLGVSDAGHAVSFVLHKTGTSATIQVELTLFKGHLASVRVR
jgi:hypothetical protein